ncbi:MAG: Flagellar motor switch protein FliN [candidate division WS2 bacterium]|nr:Flagellar motor switch protein FliN [Candidatus Psychracetigena formicireducens]
MNQLLSQNEIDALLRSKETRNTQNELFMPEEIDAIGEIANISMGTAATALHTMISKKVTITTPEVSVTTLRDVSKQYPMPFVAVEVAYTNGLKGSNLLIINEKDVKIITDLMMGGDGTSTFSELTEMHLSAIGEAMNQMIGSSCTSMSSMFNKSINISPPLAYRIILAEDVKNANFRLDEKIVKICFKMEVLGLIDSFIMQFIPVRFAKEMIEELLGQQNSNEVQSNKAQHVTGSDKVSSFGEMENGLRNPNPKPEVQKQINVQPVAFKEFEEKLPPLQTKENIDLILDVPLQISVELGKVRKLIRDILELNLGSIIELDKMAGEPVDILVNGKMIAKGEVVVIEDSFGVRITDILSPEKRVMKLGR